MTIADKYDNAIREVLIMRSGAGYPLLVLEQVVAVSLKATADYYHETYGAEAGQLSRVLRLAIRGEKWVYALLKYGDPKARVFRVRDVNYTTDKEIFMNGEEV